MAVASFAFLALGPPRFRDGLSSGAGSAWVPLLGGGIEFLQFLESLFLQVSRRGTNVGNRSTTLAATIRMACLFESFGIWLITEMYL